MFENEYRVPVLSPAVAALLGTAAELGLPVLLILGLGTRFAALALFAFNVVAVNSYPDLSDAGLKDHMLGGALLLVTFFHGPGKWSLDHAFDLSFPFDPKEALITTAVVGIGGAALFLLAFWRPPKKDDSAA